MLEPKGPPIKVGEVCIKIIIASMEQRIEVL
jgi:hypothetical protein